MNIAEQLHQKIEELNEAQQEELLYTVEQWLERNSQPDADQEERDQLIKTILVQRLAEGQKNPTKGKLFDDVMTDLDKRYGWR